MAQANVSVVVSAIDNASNVLKGIGKNIQNTLSKQTKGDVSGLTAATSGLAGGFGKLAIGAGIAGAAIAGIGIAAQSVMGTLSGFIGEAAKLEQSMLGLGRGATKFGFDAKEAQTAAYSLAKDGLITVGTAANGLQKLMVAGMGLPESIQLMQAYKDQAAFGRASTLDMDQAVNNLAESFYTENSMIGNLSGQTENYNMIIENGAKMMGKSVDSLTQAERARAKYLGTMKLAKVVEGDAAAAAGTLSGQLSVVSTAGKMLSATIGEALSPATQMLASLLTQFLAGAMEFVANNMVGLQTAAVWLGTALAVLGQIAVTVAGLVAGAFAAMAGNVDVLKGAIKQGVNGAGAIIASHNKAMENIAKKAAGGMKDAFGGAMKKNIEDSAKKKDKVTADLEKETEAFEREMQKREKSFKEQLADLIYSHLEKRDSIIKDLDEENKSYNSAMQDRVKDFKESMADMVKDHAKRMKDINRQITDENESYEESMAESKEDYTDKLSEMTSEHEKKVQALQRQIDKETAYGKLANQEKAADLQVQLNDEIAMHQQQVAKVTAEYDKDTLKKQEKHAKELEELRLALAEEDIAYEEQRLKAVERDAQEAERQRVQHEQKTADYKAQLDAENAILNKHQADVAAVKDKAKEDDITRLKRQFDEQNKEALEDHNRRMKDIKERGTAEGANMGGSINAGIQPGLEKTKTDTAAAGETAGQNFSQAIRKWARDAGLGFIEDYFNAFKGKVNEISKKTGISGASVIGMFGGEWAAIGARLLGFKQGGGIVPGPVGQETLIRAHGQEKITPAGLSGSSSGGGSGAPVSFNVYIGLYAGSETEKRNISKELYASLLQLAVSQNKTVQEYMGG